MALLYVLLTPPTIQCWDKVNQDWIVKTKDGTETKPERQRR
jgi:hypothetical protein